MCQCVWMGMSVIIQSPRTLCLDTYAWEGTLKAYFGIPVGVWIRVCVYLCLSVPVLCIDMYMRTYIGMHLDTWGTYGYGHRTLTFFRPRCHYHMGSHPRQMIGHFSSDSLAGPRDNHSLSSKHLWETPKGSEDHTWQQHFSSHSLLRWRALSQCLKVMSPYQLMSSCINQWRDRPVFRKHFLKWEFALVAQQQVSLLPFLKTPMDREFS